MLFIKSWWAYYNEQYREAAAAAATVAVTKENLASANIVKIEFNANLYLLGFPHFITFKECRKVP